MKIFLGLLWIIPQLIFAQSIPVSDHGTKEVPTWVFGAVGVSVLGYGAIRIIQARNEAVDASEQLFPGNTQGGQRGDAFRHLYVSILLKKYLSEPVSWLVMGVVEMGQQNEPKDRQMDLYNNRMARGPLFKELKKAKSLKKEVLASALISWMGEHEIILDWSVNPPGSHRGARKELKNLKGFGYVYYQN